MRFVSFKKLGSTAVGVTTKDGVVDLSIAAPHLPQSIAALVSLGKPGIEMIEKLIAKAPKAAYINPKEIKYAPPIENPGKIICVGLNYADHAAESPYKNVPEYPIFFARFANSLVAHNEPLIRPKVSADFDFEGELAVVIGQKCRHVTKDRAHEVVAGYSVFNEGSVRDYQFKSTQWLVGKDFDGSGGFGPEVVTADELPPLAKGLDLKTRLNGQEVQSANTRDMVFTIDHLIATLTEVMTLEPGDLIISGTPAGIGFARDPKLYMKHGDVCEVEIEGVGLLSNPIANEV